MKLKQVFLEYFTLKFAYLAYEASPNEIKSLVKITKEHMFHLW